MTLTRRALSLFPLLIACNAEDGAYDEKAGNMAQKLAAYDSATTDFWDENNYVVTVCWVKAGLATEKNYIRDAINDTWPANSGLTFNWPANPATDVCSPAPDGSIPDNYMPILVYDCANDDPVDPTCSTSKTGWGGIAVPGYGGRHGCCCCATSADCGPGQSCILSGPNEGKCIYSAPGGAIVDAINCTGKRSCESCDKGVQQCLEPNSGTLSECQVIVARADAMTNPEVWVKATAVHEIGHALGLPHEHQRADRPSDTPTTCVNQPPSGQTWESGNWYRDDFTWELLTEYDGLQSVMSYCRDRDGDGIADGPSWDLSTLDALGIEMLYPKNYGRKPVVVGGFGNLDGSQYIIRDDVEYTSMPDWKARGGDDSAFHNVMWRDQFGPLTGGVTRTSITLGTLYLEVQINDVLGRLHDWTGTTVIADNSQHTAIISAAIISAIVQ